MRSLIASVIISLLVSMTLSACCTSLMCNVKDVASEDLSCDDLKITNITSVETRTSGSLERTLMAEGCGKQGHYVCTPANGEKPEKDGVENYGLIEIRKSALDINWQCRPSKQ